MFLINSTGFLMNVEEHRILHLAGEVGSGKTTLAIILAHEFIRHGVVDCLISNMAVSFAVPVSLAPFYRFCCILDEAGIFFDARTFADKKQIEARRWLTGLMRKIDSVLLLSSRNSPDISFRAMAVQRTANFGIFGLPLEIFSYGFEDGKKQDAGWFGVWGRSWVWKSKRRNWSLYGSKFVPGYKETESVVNHYRRAVEIEMEKRGITDDEVIASNKGYRRWFRNTLRSAADPIYTSGSRPQDLQEQGNPNSQSSGGVSAENSPVIRSGGITFYN